MTPSPADDDQHLKKTVKKANLINDQIDQASPETPNQLWDETQVVDPAGKAEALSRPSQSELSPDEQLQAAAALRFLNEVRQESRVATEPPKMIGRYSIVRSIGRGGFAEVFLAEDQELDRRVALKVPLFNSVTNPDARNRFEREARLAASLGHPQIVPVYEYGDLGAVRFIAFSWCDGPNLSEWLINNGPVDFDTAASMVAHLAEAVQHAHQRGIIHRDLKPGNILVDSSEEMTDKPIWERLRITDFGLARNFDSQDATLTQDGQLVGTPAYMAPEQAGSGADIGPAADVWALGMMLFEFLTGQLPFRRPDIMATIRAICDDTVPSARKLRPGVPAGLDAIADLCLRKQPTERYESAHALANDLRRWQRDEPIKARPQSAWSNFVKWTRRNPVVTSLIGLTIASLAVGLAVALWQRSVAVANLNEAQTQTVRADGNLETAQALIHEIIALERDLSAQSHLVEARTKLIKRAAAYQVQLVEDEEQSPSIQFSVIRSLRQLSDILFRLGDHEAALENAITVVKLLENLESLQFEPSPGMTADIFYFMKFEQRMQIAKVLLISGKVEEAIKVHDANESATIPDGIESHRLATIQAENLRGQALTSLQLGDSEAAGESIRLALSKFDGVAPPEDERMSWNFHFTRSRLCSTLGMVEAGLGKSDSSLACFMESLIHLESCKELFPNHPMIRENEGLIAFQVGEIYEKNEDWEAAIKQFEACREIHLLMFEQNPAAINPANIYILASLALARSHKLNGSLDRCTEIANETLAKAESFPEGLKQTQAFKDNMGELELLLDSE